MRRFAFLKSAVLLAALAAPSSQAQTPIDQIVTQLEAQGFEIVELRRTLLGRIRVEARSPRYERELVFDRTTGEILRDYVQERDRTDDGGVQGGSASRSGSNSSGGSSDNDDQSGGDSDFGDDDNEDDDGGDTSGHSDDSGGDDDSSGHGGGGNSGHGGGREDHDDDDDD